MGLDRAFSRLNRGSYTAQDFFADRIDERHAFREALVAVRQRLPFADLVTDLAAPRSNVLVFYGAGGIGKSRLSRELEEIARGEGGRSANVRLDFANGSLRDPEELLLRLRVGLAELECPFLAFDALLGIYWQHQHPEQSLSDYLLPRSWSQRADLAAAVWDSIEDLIGDVTDRATLGLVGVGRRLASASVSIIQARARNSRLARDCPRFTDACLRVPRNSCAISHISWRGIFTRHRTLMPIGRRRQSFQWCSSTPGRTYRLRQQPAVLLRISAPL